MHSIDLDADGRTYAEWESAQNAGLPIVSGEDEP